MTHDGLNWHRTEAHWAGAYKSHQPIGLIPPSTTWQAPAPIIPRLIMPPHIGHPIIPERARRDVELAHMTHAHPAGIISVVHRRFVEHSSERVTQTRISMNRMFWLESVSLPAGRPACGTLGRYAHFLD
jgi:hypothetical protein